MHTIFPHFRQAQVASCFLILMICGIPHQVIGQVRVQNSRGDVIEIAGDGRQRLLTPGGANQPQTFDQDPTKFSPVTGQALPSVLLSQESRAESLQTDGRFQANPFPFKRPTTSPYVITHPERKFQAWFDPTQWTPIAPGEVNPDASAVFSYNGGQAIGILVYEPVEVDLGELVTLAFESAQSVATDVRLGIQEYRDVNNRFVLCVRMEGGQGDQVYTYFNYYYSGQGFTLQYTIYAGREVFLRNQAQFLSLLNGLVIK